MQLSLADTLMSMIIILTARIETTLLPTVSYITIYKEAVNDEVAGSNSQDFSDTDLLNNAFNPFAFIARLAYYCIFF